MKQAVIFIKLQLLMILYSVSGIAAKIASAYQAFSVEFFFWYGVEIICLGFYALFWQQVIKKTELSQAYANRSSVLGWSLLWSHFLFKERITVKNITGVFLVMLGIIVMNYGKAEEQDDAE